MNDDLSLGAGFIYNRIDVSLKSKIASQISASDASKELEGSGNSFGYSVSGLYHFKEQHNIGISTLDFVYNLVLFHDRKIYNTVGNVVGTNVNQEYATNAHVLSLNLTYKFNSKL